LVLEEYTSLYASLHASLHALLHASLHAFLQGFPANRLLNVLGELGHHGFFLLRSHFSDNFSQGWFIITIDGYQVPDDGTKIFGGVSERLGQELPDPYLLRLSGGVFHSQQPGAQAAVLGEFPIRNLAKVQHRKAEIEQIGPPGFLAVHEIQEFVGDPPFIATVIKHEGHDSREMLPIGLFPFPLFEDFD